MYSHLKGSYFLPTVDYESICVVVSDPENPTHQEGVARKKRKYTRKDDGIKVPKDVRVSSSDRFLHTLIFFCLKQFFTKLLNIANPYNARNADFLWYILVIFSSLQFIMLWKIWKVKSNRLNGTTRQGKHCYICVCRLFTFWRMKVQGLNIHATLCKSAADYVMYNNDANVNLPSV